MNVNLIPKSAHRNIQNNVGPHIFISSFFWGPPPPHLSSLSGQSVVLTASYMWSSPPCTIRPALPPLDPHWLSSFPDLSQEQGKVIFGFKAFHGFLLSLGSNAQTVSGYFSYLIPASFPAPIFHIISLSYLKFYALGNDLVSKPEPVRHSSARSRSPLLVALLEESTHILSSGSIGCTGLAGYRPSTGVGWGYRNQGQTRPLRREHAELSSFCKYGG